ncbi:hypothetical protein WM43_04615 [Aeromonas veronii]|uniref:Uncharacterized protein n=1 Tax=Aeromonas veronii TaxID=654 RepID=A0AAC9B5K1_AERVE|nr:hypothetical protein WM43_04615 [Aeromonas veronii]
MAGRSANQHPWLGFASVFKRLGNRLIKSFIARFTADLQTHGFQTSLFPQINALFRVGLFSISIAILVVIVEAISPMILEQTVKGAKSQGFMCYWIPLCGNPDLECLAIVER